MGAMTPVALFAYNRPTHTQRALQALAQCRRRDACKFHFFLDGPRTEEARPQVEAVRKVLQEWAETFDAEIIERVTNLGLARSIVSGVTSLCEQYGRVVVVEDDLIVSPDFLHYFLEALNHYEHTEQVMQVGGFTISPPAGLATDAFLLPVTTTWGWATWQRAWQSFSWQPKELEVANQDGDWLRLFNLHDTCSFSAMLADRMAGRNDSWGILWWYAVSRSRGLVVYPRHTLVRNGGFDGSGVHCGNGDLLGQNKLLGQQFAALPADLRFPDHLGYVPEHLQKLEEFFRSRSVVRECVSRCAGMKNLLTRFMLRCKKGLGYAIR